MYRICIHRLSMQIQKSMRKSNRNNIDVIMENSKRGNKGKINHIYFVLLTRFVNDPCLLVKFHVDGVWCCCMHRYRCPGDGGAVCSSVKHATHDDATLSHYPRGRRRNMNMLMGLSGGTKTNQEPLTHHPIATCTRCCCCDACAT